MKEREKQLKPGEYHVPEAGKVLGVGSAVLIGAVVASEIAAPPGSDLALTTSFKNLFEFFRTGLGATGVFGAIMGLRIVLDERASARRVSGGEKK